MKTFVCTVCGHIEFDAAPANCPICGVPQDKFQEKSDVIKKPADASNLTEGDKKHIPVILVEKKCGLIPDGCIDAHVKVGAITHVMQEEHYIAFIDFYVDKKFVTRSYFRPAAVNPAAVVHLKVKSGTLTAIENCNVHGYWMAETKI